MPRLPRIRPFVPAILLLSSAALCGKAGEPLPLTQPATRDAEPASASGVSLARFLEVDENNNVDDAEAPPVPSSPERLAYLETAASPPYGVAPMITVRAPAAPFGLIQAALLTLCAGGATGGIWFAVSRLRGCRTKPVPVTKIENVLSHDADLLSRLIAGNVRMIDEAVVLPGLTRLYGRAEPRARYRVELAPSDAVKPVTSAAPVDEGSFHRVSVPEIAVEPPHFQHRSVTVGPGDGRSGVAGGLV